ncbi:DUF2147 domain-containing protein [uncultured Sphingomonas sp.]|uniref:DUF2147 domain-containing protein n=1 Tax=uncultured Sphingomonas sp. TaxID=158754 RepID=UPI002619FFCA|nr:DUF2147 domain-containing protein [uncultured Sphingomonas sp.]
MKGWKTVAAITLGALLAAPGAAAAIAMPIGVWGNPRGTLAVRTMPCNNGVCGTIVWANDQAMADARAAGITHLVGTQLLRNYHPSRGGTWSGRLFVPDMGRSFPSHISLIAPDRLKISNCLVRHYFCRSQEWHRLR